MRYYAVFDTNVLVSALLTKNEDAATVLVLRAVADREIVPLYSEDILREYDEVLHRAKFPFSESHIRDLLLLIRQFGLSVSPGPTGEVLPYPDDLIFYEVVMEKREDDAYLITGNLRHFPKREYIVTPAEMLSILRAHREQERS